MDGVNGVVDFAGNGWKRAPRYRGNTESPRPPQPIAAHGRAAPVCSRRLRRRSHGMRDLRSRAIRFRGTPYVFARRCRANGLRDQRSRTSRASPPARATARRLTGLERYAASLYRAPLANHRVESVPSDPLADRNDLAASTGLVLIDDCLLERIVGRTRVVAGTY